MAATARVIWLCACVTTSQNVDWCSSVSFSFIVIRLEHTPSRLQSPPQPCFGRLPNWARLCSSCSWHYFKGINNKSRINQACLGPYLENSGPHFFKYGACNTRSVLLRHRADIHPVWPSRLVNKI